MEKIYSLEEQRERALKALRLNGDISPDYNHKLLAASSLKRKPTYNVVAQEQQCVTYENPYFGITIQHPSNWEVASPTTDASPPPEGRQKEIVDFRLAADDSTNEPSFGASPILDGRLTISIQIAESYLDTDTMQVKNATLQDYVQGKINEINSVYPGSAIELRSGISYKYLRDNQTTVAGNPAWKIEYMTYFDREPTLYDVTTFMINDNNLYILEFTSDPLKVPETLPIAQKMIDSFRITTIQAPSSALNATETTDPLQQFSTPPALEFDSPVEEGRIQNDEEEDRETDEDD